MKENDQEIDLSLAQYLAIISRRRWVVIVVTLVVFAAAACYAMFWPPVFRATTVLNIEREGDGATGVGGFQEVQDDAYFETQFKLIMSNTALGHVYNELSLSSSTDFARGPGTLYKAITIVQVPRTRLCQVNADSTDPRLAMMISSALSRYFVEQSLNNKINMSKDVLDALQARVNSADAERTNQSLPSVVNNKLIQDIKSQIFQGEAQLADLRMKYTDSHPALISLKSRLASMQKVLNIEVSNIVASLKTELSGQLRANNVRIVDLPQLPVSPVRPRKALALVFGLIGGFSLGVMFAFLFEMLDQTVRTQDDIERRVGLPFLGLIPFSRHKRGAAVYEPLLSADVSLLSESFRNLRTMVNLTDAVVEEPILLVTSSVQEEGKSFVASNLAVAMAQLGKKVLIIDGDLRRPHQHGNMHASSETGLVDFLSGAVASPETLVQKTSIANLDIVTCGLRPPNPAELLNTEHLAQFVAWARGRYARVIVDCPPVFPISDIQLWGRHVKPTIFVTRFGRTRVPLIQTACARLRGCGMKILGGVINGARLGTMTYADGRYYEQYYRDYVDSGKGKERRS
jgi:capsular exopolysaccharide synthesis family protein